MLEPLEMVVIAIVALVFLMWGPKKIPELAKSIGLARREFNNASAAASGKELPASSAAPKVSAAAPAVPSTGDALIDTAKKLGIRTEGKSRQEISEAIVQKV